MKDGRSKIISNTIIIPDNVKIGDIIVVKYKESHWGNRFFWEDWHHVSLIININTLIIIEAVGENLYGQYAGPTQILFENSIGFGKSLKNIVKIKWLKPIFPNPIREIDNKKTPISKRKILTENEARNRVVKYAIEQTKNNEPYNKFASKWDENEWYCSLLVYKSFSRTITYMYLEDYSKGISGYFVTPEDIVDSKRTEVYFTWYNSYYFQGDIPIEDIIYWYDKVSVSS